MASSIAVIQARTSSSRLPAKALLPVAGYPLAILCSKRAGNQGRQVLLATSNEPSDDLLSQMARKFGLGCYRGSLNNPLQRIVESLKDFGDETLVFRLTADNLFPDGTLLDQLEQRYLEDRLDYLCCNGERSGLPYGVSVELMRVRHLREALENATTDNDLEHVTPYVRRVYGEVFFDQYKAKQMGHFRATIDCFDDYLSIQKVFDKVDDPINVPFMQLVDMLPSTPFQPIISSPSRKLVLGTAQLGMHYGVTNTTGKPNKVQAVSMIKKAIINGVSFLDTARAYGESEAVIGEVLEQGWSGRTTIVTKLSPLSSCPDDASEEVVRAFVDASIYASCSTLRVRCLDVLLLHRASQIDKWQGAVWKRLRQLKSEGMISRLGVSVQTPQELEMCIKEPEVLHLQMPYNILDWRWDSLIPVIQKARSNRGLVVHLRSSLLQGLLSSNEHSHWLKAGISDADIVLSWLDKILKASGLPDLANLCLLYCYSQDWMDGVVVGTENINQLTQNIQSSILPVLDNQLLKQINQTRPRLSEQALNPSAWLS